MQLYFKVAWNEFLETRCFSFFPPSVRVVWCNCSSALCSHSVPSESVLSFCSGANVKRPAAAGCCRNTKVEGLMWNNYIISVGQQPGELLSTFTTPCNWHICRDIFGLPNKSVVSTGSGTMRSYQFHFWRVQCTCLIRSSFDWGSFITVQLQLQNILE